MSVSAGRAALAALLRAANFFVMALGGFCVGYGGYLATRFPGADLLWTGVIALGAIDFLFAAAILFCAWRSLFALRLYGTVLGLLEIAELALVMLYWIPSTRERVISAAGLPADLRDDLETHLTFSGLVLSVAVGFQALTLALTACQCSAVDPLNQGLLDEEPEARALVPKAGRGGDRGEGKGASSSGGGGGGGGRRGARDTGGDEDLESAASSRYKSSAKAAAYYEKYGVR